MSRLRPSRAPGRRSLLAVLAACFLVASCGSGSAGSPTSSADAASGRYPGWPIGPVEGLVYEPTIVNGPGELAVGPSRFLFSLLDPSSGAPVADPSIAAQLSFYDLAKDPATSLATASGTFVWAIPDKVGLYHATVDFTATGDWGVQFDLSGGKAGTGKSVRLQFQVSAHSSTTAVGEAFPSIDTPTATGAEAIKRISTDPDPDPDFYKVSEAQALASHTPFVLVIATPQFCQSQVCGPTLDHVKEVAPPYEATVDFIHVEPYVLKWDGNGLQPVLDATGNFQLQPALAPLHLPSEPWVFVVGKDGTLAAKFEGAFGSDELQAALATASGG
ncbi:MAG TPA: hypothetical protein VFW92_05750 [Candidatus Limnocylindrales bacterium]|nr:hypothetical protein [Candidatus Limnocylindrales bacterium]